MKHDSGDSFDQRIHSYLDGELDPLEAERVERLLDADPSLKRRVETIRDLQQWMDVTRPTPPPTLADRVMERITSGARQSALPSEGGTDRKGRTGWRDWFGSWLHPAWVGAAGVAVIAGLLLLSQRPADRVGNEGAGPVRGATADIVEYGAAGQDGAGLIRHDFRLEAPGAQQVCLVGNFNRWKVCATPLERIRDNLWQISVDLKRGRHEYMFVVDNKWISDPRAAVQVDDGFGHRNAVLIL